MLVFRGVHCWYSAVFGAGVFCNGVQECRPAVYIPLKTLYTCSSVPVTLMVPSRRLLSATGFNGTVSVWHSSGATLSSDPG